MSEFEASYLNLPNKIQICLIFCSRFIEPFTFACCIPYTYYLLESFGYTDPSNISSLSTLVVCSFAFGQAISAIFWGKMSEMFGRKPVILSGLVGLAVSLLMLGMAQNIITVLIARVIGGFISGNAGVMRTMVGELCHGPHRIRAFSILQLAANIGALAGPILGSYLADPLVNHNWQWVEAWRGFHEKYPYFLASAGPLPVIVITFLLSLYYLEETQPHDPSMQPLLEKDSKPELSRHAKWTIADYGLLSSHIAVFMSMFPLFLSAPVKEKGWVIFGGGLGINESDMVTVCTILALAGVFFQVLVYPVLATRIGVPATHKLGTWLYIPAYSLTPYVTWMVVKGEGPPLMTLTVVAILTSASRAFTMGAMDVLITNSATKDSLAHVNAVAQTVHCITSFIGTLLLGYIYSVGLKIGVIGLGWWVMSMVVVAELAVGHNAMRYGKKDAVDGGDGLMAGE